VSAAVVAALAVSAVVVSVPASGQPSAPKVRKPVVVMMGDSYASGEAGRWKGNTNGADFGQENPEAVERADAGARSYWDTPTGEKVPGCHRSKVAQIHFSARVRSINLACSGARATTEFEELLDRSIPGIDMSGQLGDLVDILKKRRVSMIVLGVGGNNFGFSTLLTQCVSDFLLSNRLFRDYCFDDAAVEKVMADAPEVRTKVRGAIVRIISAMRDAGYADDSWSLLVQGYPSAVAPGDRMRWSIGDRHLLGGCPFWSGDLYWVNNTVVPTLNENVFGAAADAQEKTGKVIHTVDITNAFEGRRLCETGTKLVEETTTELEQLDRSERVSQLRISCKFSCGPFTLTESLHPNFYGQKALANCIRKAWNGGAVRSGVCSAPESWTKLNEKGQPDMTFIAQ
jgi:hypothetical protein